MPKVLNIKDCGYKVPSGAVYVGRAMPRYALRNSKWGNPFKMNDSLLPSREGKRKAVIDEYRLWIIKQPKLMDSLSELKGKDLVCWCHSWDGQGDNPMFCHADILLKLANK